MTPERWQQISRIFKSAMSLDGEARDDYLNGVDSSLRAEVNKLLDSHQKASDEKFIDGMAAEANAALLIDDELNEEPSHRLNRGQQLGSYVVLDALGAGGMGEVYLAKDTRLDRTVALKVLSEEVASDHRRMQRFRQEAKIASSLNQPNILTIYEFAEVEGLTFLATEFIDGETLREHLRAKKFKIGEILDLAIQVLAALDAAHEARIIHRDIKPENVMIRRRDHVVKVLDFGLAKTTGERKSSTFTAQESEAATEFKTAPHVLMGTINYMSPEQAQAHAVDVRTDIWSTGVMIYEMVSGLMPFRGSTHSHTIVQILEKDPVPLTNFAQRKVPAELQRIVSKALAKNADERYQTAKDMLIDLRNFKKRLDVEAEIDRTSSPESPRPTIVSEDIDHGPKKKRVVAIAMVAMVIVTAGILAFSIWRASRARTNPTSAVAPPVPVEERALSYSITVQKFRDGKEYEKPFTLPGEINFETDYEIRIQVRTPQPGHLYIYNEGPPEGSAPAQLVVLFPTETANKRSSLLAANQVVQIPEKSRFRFDKEQGTEKVWLIFSADAIPELEAIGAADPSTQGEITDPARNKVIQDFLAKHSAQKASVEKDEKQTTLKIPSKLLVYPVKLEHH